MRVTVTIDLPPSLARRAARMGFLKPDGIRHLIEREVAIEKAVPSFRRMVTALRARADTPMTMDKVQAEVDASRAKRRLIVER
jgi:hypothetical protein